MRSQFGDFLGPGVIDSQLRQTINMAWMALPEDKRSIDELEKMIRHFVDRAFRDIREDRDTFGLSG